jgi:hypothetical protein
VSGAAKLFRDFSTAWKTFGEFFHTMENFFPHCEKLPCRPLGAGLSAGFILTRRADVRYSSVGSG